MDIAPDFKSTVGFVTRTGITKMNAFFNPKFYPESGAIQRIDPLIYYSVTLDKPSELFESSLFGRMNINMARSTRFNITGSWASEVYEAEIFDRSRAQVGASSQITKRVNLSTEFRLQNRPYYSDNEQGYGKAFEGGLILQASDNFNAELEYNFSDLYSRETNEKYYDVHIIRSKNTYQLNKYLFVRAIVQYDSYSKVLAPNFLASFTYIPGTVVHLGWGAVYDQTSWDPEAADYVDSAHFNEKSQGLFFKASYLWRL